MNAADDLRSLIDAWAEGKPAPTQHEIDRRITAIQSDALRAALDEADGQHHMPHGCRFCRSADVIQERLLSVSIAGHRRVEKYAEQEADAAARKNWSMADRFRHLASGNAETVIALDAALEGID